MNLKRKFIAATCLILGAVLLIPASIQLWSFFVSRLSTQHLRYLPKTHTDFMFSINGLTVDNFTVTLIVTVAGAVLLLTGGRMLIRADRQ